MKKRCAIVIGLVLLVALSTGAAAQSVGGGLSFWVPESLYTGQGGSVGVESALGSSISFGDLLSLPFGVAYNKVYGLQVEGEGVSVSPPWFVSDTILGFVMAKARIGLGPLYLDLFGGGAGVWNMTLTPLTANIAGTIGGAGELAVFDGAPTIDEGRFGWGWQAGGGIGAQVGPVAVDLNVTYRSVKSPATITGSYFLVDTAGPSVAAASYGPIAVLIRLVGFSVGIDAAFSM